MMMISILFNLVPEMQMNEENTMGFPTLLAGLHVGPEMVNMYYSFSTKIIHR